MEPNTGLQGERVPRTRPPQQNGDTEDKTKQAADKAQEQVGQAKNRAREQVRDQVSQRSTEAGERVRSAAGDVRVGRRASCAARARTRPRASRAGGRPCRAAGRLPARADGDRILRDVEDFGRRHPWAVVAGGLALGFVASRLLKASSSERYRPARASRRAAAGPRQSPDRSSV